MHMPEGDPHPSTLPGFRGTRDPERSVTRSRSRKKKKQVEFKDVQPQSIPNPTQENFPRMCITQLPDGVSHIYYTGKELTYWFYEYCRVGHPIVKEEVKYHIDHRTVETITWEPWFDSAVSETDDVTGEVRISLDPPLSMSPHISPAALHEMRQAGMGNLDLFGPSALRAGITPVVVTSASVHSLSQNFSLPGEAEGPDLGWHMEWIGQRERLPIACLRDPPPMSSSYGIEKLWHLTHGMRRLVLAESARDAQRLQEVEDELAIAVGKLTVWIIRYMPM
ncbi:hypothetical protein GIB67_023402 [Kingdonia uniflora]|uniref:Uncharacterized protein n=1 Tax=Kingdonia uniflora TaxID=39325 RepID=A0A7J7MID3_9MAGN|nr:hypothetical protein GIB67_023402 [Kingdonia uniflora]